MTSFKTTTPCSSSLSSLAFVRASFVFLFSVLTLSISSWGVIVRYEAHTMLLCQWMLNDFFLTFRLFASLCFSSSEAISWNTWTSLVFNSSFTDESEFDFSSCYRNTMSLVSWLQFKECEYSNRRKYKPAHLWVSVFACYGPLSAPW